MNAKLLRNLVKDALSILGKKQFGKNEVSVVEKKGKVIFKYKKLKIIISEVDKLELIESSNVDFYDLLRITQIIDRAFADYKTLKLRNEC